MKSILKFTLSSVHGAQVRVKCIETIEHVSCLFEVVDVLEGSNRRIDMITPFENLGLLTVNLTIGRTRIPKCPKADPN